MGIVRKLKDAARWVENVAEHEAPRTDDAEPETQAPSPKPAPKAELTVVAPTPLSGGRSLRVLRAAGFAGVVAVTASAALVGRCRR